MNRLFDKNLFILEELFGKEEVSVKLDRLKYIFENTEEKWAENLKLLKNSEIRYLLICEAPPFSEIEPPKYFYNYHNKNFNKLKFCFRSSNGYSSANFRRQKYN